MYFNIHATHMIKICFVGGKFELKLHRGDRRWHGKYVLASSSGRKWTCNGSWNQINETSSMIYRSISFKASKIDFRWKFCIKTKRMTGDTFHLATVDLALSIYMDCFGPFNRFDRTNMLSNWMIMIIYINLLERKTDEPLWVGWYHHYHGL